MSGEASLAGSKIRQTAETSGMVGRDSDLSAACVRLWRAVQKEKPLVQCITNFVSMDIMANALNAVGASPAMVHGVDEVEEFVHLASALVINVGTLSRNWTEAMLLAAKTASAAGKPWVLDPVGAGATKFRMQVIMQLLSLKPTVVRGNASEVMALAGASGATRGVDSTASSSEALDAGQLLAQKHDTIVAISGEHDYITDGWNWLRVSNGVEMMTKITAAGCSVTAVIAAFLAVSRPGNAVHAAASALAAFGLAAELGDRNAAGPASLRVNLLDQLYIMSCDLTKEQASMLKIQSVEIRSGCVQNLRVEQKLD